MDLHNILLLLLLPGLALAQQCNLPGDCKGNSLDIDIVDSERGCLEHCKIVDGCEWYSYDANDGFCNALKDCPEVDLDCTTCIHGENECQLPLMCFVEGECHGNYITHVDVATSEECLERCYNDHPDCKYFSFFTEDKVCNFFKTCSLDEDQTGVVSGERDCYGGGGQKRVTKLFLQHGYRTAWAHLPSHEGNSNATGCEQPPDFPVYREGATAQVINGSITVCGGYTSYSDCFSLDTALNIWVEFAELNIARGVAASDMTPDGWWITGGFSTTADDTSSLFNGSHWNEGPSLPLALKFHCMTKVNQSHLFISGGLASNYLSVAYLFDWTTQVWTQVPDMPTAKDVHACVPYQDGSMGPSILVAGGSSNVNPYRNVEALSLTTLEWATLPDLPTDATYCSFVHDGSDLILVNLRLGNFLRFNPGDRTFDVVSGPTLSMYELTVSLAVGDDQLHGCA